MTVRDRFDGARSEAGETLVEVLMASALMALVVVAVIGGISTMLLGSKVNRDEANANTYLVRAMEQIKSTDFQRWTCGDAVTAKDYYEAEARKVTLPAGWTIGIDPANPIQFEYIDTSGPTPAVKFGSSCSETTPLQLITLQVSSKDLRTAPTLAFIKGTN